MSNPTFEGMQAALQLEGRRRGAGRAWWAGPVAAAVHVAALGCAVAASMVVADTVADPDFGLVSLQFAPPPPPTAPRGGSKPKSGDVPKPKPAPAPKAEIVQPVRAEALTPDDLKAAPADENVGGGGSGPAIDGALPGDGADSPTKPLLPAVEEPPKQEASAPEEPLIVVGDVRPPELTQRIEPSYPEPARIARIEGRVILQAVIDERGAVEDVRVLRSVPTLDAAAVAAVRQWRYRPALLEGRPVRVYFTVVVTFKLQ